MVVNTLILCKHLPNSFGNTLGHGIPLLCFPDTTKLLGSGVNIRVGQGSLNRHIFCLALLRKGLYLILNGYTFDLFFNRDSLNFHEEYPVC